MASIPQPVIETLLSQINADPALPRPNPTISFWQLPPHDTLASTRSPALPQYVDYAIIGSGVTGCSIASNLLSNPSFPSTSRIAVLEARNLCSGATGRNGGALTSWVPYDFTNLIDRYGEAEAIKIGRYAYRTLEKMHSLGSSTTALQSASEVRRVRDVLGFMDHESFAAAQRSFQHYESLIPECKLNLQVLSATEVLEQYNMKSPAGALLVDCGAFWPYRLITSLWANLLSSHSAQLSLETNTPVQSITFSPTTNLYTLTTPHGPLTARTVIHATNGYTGHLLPTLRGKIHPLRGTMSTQATTPAFGHHGSARAWSIAGAPKYDPATNIFEAGLYYSNQNPVTQDIFIGGESVDLSSILVADDTIVRPEARENIESVLPRYFAKGWAAEEEEKPEIRKVWSGIMGFTSDGLPLVGRLPDDITQRPRRSNSSDSSSGTQATAPEGAGGEYIAAGFNGYGMPQCWSAGEAVAKIVLGRYDGDDVAAWLPACYLCTEERLAGMGPEASLRHLTGVEVGEGEGDTVVAGRKEEREAVVGRQAHL